MVYGATDSSRGLDLRKLRQEQLEQMDDEEYEYVWGFKRPREEDADETCERPEDR